MSPGAVIQKYFDCWKEAVLLLRRPIILLPFLLLALCKLSVLLLLRYFASPPVSYFMVDIVRIVGGESSLHYPSHFVMLPYLYEIATMPVVAAGFVLFGWGVFMIADYYDGHLLSPKNYIDKIVWNLPAFLFIGIVYSALAVSVPFVLALGAKNIDSPFWQTTLERFSWLIGFGARVVLVYALLFVKLYQDDLMRALRESIRFSMKRLFLTAMIILSISAIHGPLSYLTGHSDVLAAAFAPERIHYLIEARIIVELFTGYFLFSTTTYLAIGGKRVLR